MRAGVRRITIGWFVRQGDVRRKGKYLAWTEYSMRGQPIVWDRHMRMLFKRKFDAMQAIRKLHPSAARLVRHVRQVVYSDGFRICRFCGCHTNAKLRRCCSKGAAWDTKGQAK